MSGLPRSATWLRVYGWRYEPCRGRHFCNAAHCRLPNGSNSRPTQRTRQLTFVSCARTVGTASIKSLCSFMQIRSTRARHSHRPFTRKTGLHSANSQPGAACRSWDQWVHQCRPTTAYSASSMPNGTQQRLSFVHHWLEWTRPLMH
jgi:hypothetical protein